MKIKNSVDPQYVPAVNRSMGGLGLNNARQRLDLIYARQYKLSSTKQNEYFEVDLEIDLS